jgi:hypothetical protein
VGGEHNGLAEEDRVVNELPGSLVHLVVDETMPATPDRPAPFLAHRTDGQRGVITVLEQTIASPEEIFDLLADLRQHQDWAGNRHPEWLQRVAWIGGPDRLELGSHFDTRQATRLGYWIDHSVVVEARPPDRFGFDTRGIHVREDGVRTAAGAWTHRYRLVERTAGGSMVELITRYVLAEGRVTRTGAPFIALNVQRGVQNLIQLAEERVRYLASPEEPEADVASA